MESRTQGSKPRPSTQKKSEQSPGPRTALLRTDTLDAKNRNARAKAKDQGHMRKCSPKKRSSRKFFSRSPKIKVFKNIFQANYKISTIQKIVLSSSRGQSNFWGLEASRSRPRPKTWPSRLMLRTLKCVLEAKDVLEDSILLLINQKYKHSWGTGAKTQRV